MEALRVLGEAAATGGLVGAGVVRARLRAGPASAGCSVAAEAARVFFIGGAGVEVVRVLLRGFIELSSDGSSFATEAVRDLIFWFGMAAVVSGVHGRAEKAVAGRSRKLAGNMATSGF